MATTEVQTINRQHKNFEQLLTAVIDWMVGKGCEFENIETLKDNVESITLTCGDEIEIKLKEKTKSTED